MSGGACFTPQLNPRPTYPSFLSIIMRQAKSYARVSILGTIATVILYTTYIDIVNFFMSRGFGEPFIFSLLTGLVHGGFYIGWNLSFHIFREYIADYQFTRKDFQVPTVALVKRTLIEAVFGIIIITPPLTYAVWYYVFKYFGMPRLDAPLPEFSRIIVGWLVSIFFNDFGFYWAHRAFHHPILYGRFHKQHHSYIGTIGIAAEFASLPEQIFANTIPSIGGCLFFGCHGSALIFMLWLACRLSFTYEAHSGYCFYGTFLHKLGLTYSNGAAYHDFHHTKNQGNFGSSLMDYLFGTMDAWVEAGECEGYIERYRRAECDSRSEKTKVM